MKKLTIKELMTMKEQLKGKKSRKVSIEVAELGVVEARVPDMTDIADSKQHDDPDVYLVYSCITEPNLKDQELQGAYGVSDPTDIVGEIFEPGQINGIAEILIGEAGFKGGSVKIVKEIKN